MDSATLAVLACATMLAVAGCSGGPTATTTNVQADGSTPDATNVQADGSTPDATTRDAATNGTAGTTTEDSTGTGFEALDTPSWLTVDGVVAASLVDAHRASLAGSSARVESRQTASGLYSLSRTTTMRVGADGRRVYTVRTRTDGANATTHAFVNDTRVFVERTNATRSVYSDYRVGPDRTRFDVSTQVRSFVRLGDFAVNRTHVADGGTRIEYVASEPSDVADADAIDAYRGRLVVSPDGRVHELVVEATESSSYGDVNTTFAFELAAVGGVDASTPSWVAEARERATTVDLAYEHADGVLAITHEGGDVVPAGTSVVVGPMPGGGVSRATLPRNLAAGETLYVAPTGPRTLAARFGSPPTADHDLPTSLTVSMYAADGEVVVRTTVDSRTNDTASGAGIARPILDAGGSIERRVDASATGVRASDFTASAPSTRAWIPPAVRWKQN